MKSRMDNPLLDLARSTYAFHDRFGVIPTVENASNNFLEEVHEFVDAARLGHNRNHIAEEAADVLVTVLGLCRAAGIELDELLDQIYAVIEKNDAKTTETHAFMEGKIRRRENEG